MKKINWKQYRTIRKLKKQLIHKQTYPDRAGITVTVEKIGG